MKRINFIKILLCLGLIGSHLAFASNALLTIVNNANISVVAYRDNNVSPLADKTYLGHNQSGTVQLGDGGNTMTSDMTLYDSKSNLICHIQTLFLADDMPFDNWTTVPPPTFFNVANYSSTVPANMIRLYGVNAQYGSNATIVLDGPGFMSPFPDKRSSNPAQKCYLTYVNAGDISRGTPNFSINMTIIVTDYDPNNNNVFADYPQ